MRDVGAARCVRIYDLSGPSNARYSTCHTGAMDRFQPRDRIVKTEFDSAWSETGLGIVIPVSDDGD